ncbi:uncharacterized protein FTOL_06737 [Fusarium torulosum]|uniref:Uncharacterized protein n=1 Tax=Fusarium torulosum TaxID=33205 RepID=A0AAE8MAD1_9HYPO|nr:uncharacterized protein FTOL_06737 [Fusarium torulosum]
MLTTLNYALYLRAYFDYKADGIKSQARSWVKSKDVVSVLPGSDGPESSRFARLGGVISVARLTLRLFGLLPIYLRIRQLMSSKGMDQILYFIAALQCSLFATYQFLENIAFLTDKGVLPKCGLGRWTGGHSSTVYMIVHRLGSGHYIFFRRKHIDQGDITEEEAEKASQWYPDWIRPLAWLPIRWHLSSSNQDGLPGFNLGVKGAAGLLADLGKTASFWHDTQDVI